MTYDPEISPVWKTIDEASNDLVMFVERPDGYRIPVRRHFWAVNNQYMIPEPRFDLNNQIREYADLATRENLARMQGLKDEAALLHEHRMKHEAQLASRMQSRSSRIFPAFNDFTW